MLPEMTPIRSGATGGAGSGRHHPAVRLERAANRTRATRGRELFGTLALGWGALALINASIAPIITPVLVFLDRRSK